MSVDLNSIPTTNTLEFRIRFFLDDEQVGQLAAGEADVMDFRFNRLGLGNYDPLHMYDQETPGNFTVSPGSIAFVDRSVPGKLALRFGRPNETQQNVIFA